MADCDFVPEECAALALQACIAAKQCFLDNSDIFGNAEGVGFAADASAGASISIGGQDECTIAALKAAFANAGCPFPILPQAPPAPDLSDCTQAADDLSARASNPLGFLDGIMTLEFDANGKPIRITVP